MMKIATLLNLDKSVPRELRRRLALEVGDIQGLDANTVVSAQADIDRATGRRSAVLEVFQPGQICRHRIEDGRFVHLWINGAPAALVPRAVECDGHGRVLRLLVDVVFHQAEAVRSAA